MLTGKPLKAELLKMLNNVGKGWRKELDSLSDWELSRLLVDLKRDEAIKGRGGGPLFPDLTYGPPEPPAGNGCFSHDTGGGRRVIKSTRSL